MDETPGIRFHVLRHEDIFRLPRTLYCHAKGLYLSNRPLRDESTVFSFYDEASAKAWLDRAEFWKLEEPLEGWYTEAWVARDGYINLGPQPVPVVVALPDGSFSFPDGGRPLVFGSYASAIAALREWRKITGNVEPRLADLRSRDPRPMPWLPSGPFRTTAWMRSPLQPALFPPKNLTARQL